MKQLCAAIFILIALLLSPAFHACAGDSPIRIGICVSDDDVVWEEIADWCMAGIMARFAAINNEGGVDGRPLKAVVYVTGHEPAAAKEDTAHFLRENPDVNVVIALGSTGMARGMARAARETKDVVGIFPCAIDPRIDVFAPYFSCFLPTYDDQAEALARYLHESGQGRLGVITDEESFVQHQLGIRLGDFYASYGETVTGHVTYRDRVIEGDEDYRPMLRVLAESQPDIIALFGYPQEVAAIIRQAADERMRARFFGGISWNSEPLFLGAGYNLTGCFFLDYFMDREDCETYPQLLEAMQQRGRYVPGLEAAAGWDVAGLLADAYREGGGDASELHARFLRAVETMPQVTGPGVVDRKKRIHKRMRLLRVGESAEHDDLTVIAEFIPDTPRARLVIAK